MKSFAPWWYYLKAAFLLSMALSLEIYMHLNNFYDWKMAAVVGLFYALIGKKSFNTKKFSALIYS